MNFIVTSMEIFSYLNLTVGGKTGPCLIKKSVMDPQGVEGGEISKSFALHTSSSYLSPSYSHVNGERVCIQNKRPLLGSLQGGL